MNASSSIISSASNFVAHAPGRVYPEDVAQLARMCLADWYGVSLGARGEPAGEAVCRLVAGWRSHGRAPLLFGGAAAPAPAALANGTFAHCLDFDDLHFPSLSHLSAPTWAAVLALGAETGAGEQAMLGAFITGFEIGAKLGSNGVGEAVSARGWHSTGVVGRLAAAAASAALLGLDHESAAHALGLAATQTSGLTASFGTDSKPFHAGRAAFDGVIAAQLARDGFRAATDLLDRDDGLSRALVQDGAARMRIEGLGIQWELRRNAIKPYACCGLTHAPVDAARQLSSKIGAAEVRSAHLTVHPLTPKVASKNPTSPLAAKFSVTFCVALALRGHRASARDFSPERIADRAITDLAAKVAVVPEQDMAASAARLDVLLADGRKLRADVPVSLGNPENPMSWDDLHEKFMALVDPVAGERAQRIFAAARAFGSGPRAEGLLLAAEMVPAAV